MMPTVHETARDTTLSCCQRVKATQMCFLLHCLYPEPLHIWPRLKAEFYSWFWTESGRKVEGESFAGKKIVSYELISLCPKALENTKEIKYIVKHLRAYKNKTYNLETMLEFQSFQPSSYVCSTRYDIVMLSESIQLNPKSTVFLSSFIVFLSARLNWRKKGTD